MSPEIGNVAQWGLTLHGVEATARSALGEDSAGDILYAASMSALPLDLATALSDDGATDAMELDINPEWIQLDLASTAGGPLATIDPGTISSGRSVSRRLDTRLHHGDCSRARPAGRTLNASRPR